MNAGVFRWTRRVVGVATLMTVIAIILYPGGTLRDHEARGYSFFHNFLSDLGATVAFGGHPNRPSALLFMTSLLLMVVALAVSLGALLRLHSQSPAARPYARAAVVAGALVCLCFAGVALAPEDRVFNMHLQFTFWGFRTFPLAGLMLALAARRDPRFSPAAALGWLVLTIVVAAYVADLQWGPVIGTEFGLVFQVTAQKIVAIVGGVVIVLQTYEAERALGERSELMPAAATA